VLHTNYESDTALDLYEDSLDSPFYSVYGYYGRPDFLELAGRLGILEKRAIKIIDSFIQSEPLVKSFIERSQLTKASEEKYLYKLADKTSRLKPRVDKNTPVA
jgi:serine/threonine-protein kinase HipA